MALAEFLSDLDQLADEGQRVLAEAKSGDVLEAARVQFLGAKSGRLKVLQNRLGKIDRSDKPAAGKRFNEVKRALEDALQAAKSRLSTDTVRRESGVAFDATVPGRRPRIGRLHPITQTINDLMEIMDDRYERSSTIIISQLPTDQWYQSIGDSTLADSILDRLMHNAHRIKLKGESRRKLKSSLTHGEHLG